MQRERVFCCGEPQVQPAPETRHYKSKKRNRSEDRPLREQRSGVEAELDFGEDGGIGGGSGAFLRSDPCTHAIGGGIDGGERRAAQSVMDHSGGESVTGADSVGNFYFEAGMFVVRLRGDEKAAIGTAGDADQAEGKFAAQPAGGGDVRKF